MVQSNSFILATMFFTTSTIKRISLYAVSSGVFASFLVHQGGQTNSTVSISCQRGMEYVGMYLHR